MSGESQNDGKREKKIAVVIHEAKEPKDKLVRGLEGSRVTERSEDLKAKDFKSLDYEEQQRSPGDLFDAVDYYDFKEESDEDEDEPKCLADSLAALVGKPKFHDVMFIVGEDKVEIPAHRMMLGTRSKVFDTMLYPPSGSQKDSKDTVIEIRVPDCTPDAFYIMLRHLYAGIVEMDADLLRDILYVARKYSIDTLKYECLEFLKKGLTVENVCQLLESEGFSDSPYPFEFIEDHTDEILPTLGFLKLTKKSIEALYGSQNLKVNELQLYIQLLEWGRAECRRSGIDPTNENLREMIWPMLQNIRFTVMNMEDIAKTVNNTNILTSKEILALLTYQGIKVKEDKEKEEKEKDKDKDKDYKEEKEEKDGKGQTTTTSRGGLPEAWFNTEKKTRSSSSDRF